MSLYICIDVLKYCPICDKNSPFKQIKFDSIPCKFLLNDLIQYIYIFVLNVLKYCLYVTNSFLKQIKFDSIPLKMIWYNIIIYKRIIYTTHICLFVFHYNNVARNDEIGWINNSGQN
jgi:hypothetical protein